MADDASELVLNPGVNLKIQCVVRRNGQPVSTFELSDGNRELVRWLLAVMDTEVADDTEAQVEISDRVMSAAVEAGVLVRPDEVPDPAVPYRCGPEDSVLALVAPAAIAMARAADPARLALNPRVYIQQGPEPPAELKDRIRLGNQLWAHLGDDFSPGGPRSFAPGERLLWVEQPVSEIVEPIWIPDAIADEVGEAATGRRRPAELTRAARETMLLSRALVETPRDDAASAKARDELQGDGFTIVRDMFSPLTKAALRRHFRGLRSAGYFEIDVDQVVGMRDGMYCEVATLFFQQQFARFLNRHLDEPVRGSFAWVRRYYPGAVLTRHRDRQQCRWNVSLCVDMGPGDDVSPWPFYLESNAIKHEVMLEIGDAVVYSGTGLSHWRDALPAGRQATMCFYHYVSTSFTGSLR